MKLIVGLGNPGDKYKNNRHNTGFMALDYFANQNQLNTFKSASKYKAETLEHTLGREKAILVKPHSFMNLSGEVVKQIANYHKLHPRDVLVVYDELALNFGTIRTRSDGSSAGHNGVESIINHLGKGFKRVRIGVANKYASKTEAEKFVLADFGKDEAAQLTHVFDYVNHLIQEFITLGVLEDTTHNTLEKLI